MLNIERRGLCCKKVMEQSNIQSTAYLSSSSISSHEKSSLSSQSLHLEEHITLEQFSNIMADFKNHPKVKGGTKMTMETFRESISKLLGRSPNDKKILLLCSKIDADSLGFIDGDEFSSYILQQLKEKDSLSQTFSPFSNPPRFRHITHSKEIICRLVLATNPLRYISISKDGLVGTWNSHFQYQQGMHVSGVTEGKAKGKFQVVDFALMSNCNKIVMSTSSRELIFCDVSTRIYKCQYRVHDLPCIPLCLCYYSNPESSGSKSFLLYGDLSGSVAVFTFHKPLSGLFCGSNKDGDCDKPFLIAHGNLEEHSRLVSMEYIPCLHSDWVTQIRYTPHNHTFISCSCTPNNSVIIRDILHKANLYTFKMRKGVICFDYCHSLGLLVTGSLDHMVCMWNPYVPSRPIATLEGHDTTLLSVVIAKEQDLVFSLSQDLVLCAWDVFDHFLVQKITLNFPFSQRIPEFGTCPMTLLPTVQSLAILCNNYVAELKLGLIVKAKSDSNVFTSHKHSLCSALYSKHFNQVVSGCEGGVISVWDMDSGNLVLRFDDCHGKNELTAMNLDHTGHRLLTGSRAGDIKVWQYLNSTCIKHVRKDGYSEVTGIIHITEKGLFLSVGWDKKITAFEDNPDVFDAVPNESWKTQETHHLDDILCMDYCSPHYLATGSFDGKLKVWNTDLERLLMQFQSITKVKHNIIKKTRSKSFDKSMDSFTSIKKSWSSLHSPSSRPSSQRLANYRLRSAVSGHMQHVSIDQVLFLSMRMHTRNKGSAVLVTSEAGIANFWDIYGHERPKGSFSMTEYEEENVLAMKTDVNEEHLLAGDTAGIIAIFNIKTYCTDEESGGGLEPIARWRAHSKEIVSIEYILHGTQSLILSASGDGTVRLWTLLGHFIGTFGQDQPWDLKSPSTFQHPRTPWGEMWKTNVNHSVNMSNRSISRLSTPLSQVGRAKNEDQILEESEEPIQGTKPRVHHASISQSSAEEEKLSPIIMDKSLGETYDEQIHKRMADRLKRRTNFSGKGVKATTEKFGSNIFPFHGLQISKMEEVHIPENISLAINKAK